ncbi:MAG: helix-turn-helix domain-containing protein [Pseudomonadota bacterium]|jgi:DNA-binding XRE family transcriptional regulator
MPNIGSLLKEEIARLSRREARRQNAALKKAAAAHRRHIAALRQQIVRLEKEVKALGSSVRRAPAAAPGGDDAGGGKLRFQARGLKTLRARLGLSAGDLGKLLGVTGQSVYNWEARKATPRREQLAALAALRGAGKREIQVRLEGAGGSAPEASERPAETRRGKPGPARKTGRKAARKPARPRKAKAEA